MEKKRLKPKGLMVISVIVIISFVYGVNVQPVVFGDTFDFIFRFPFYFLKHDGLKTFSSYDEFFDYLSENSNKELGYNGYYDGDFIFFNTPRSNLAAESTISKGSFATNDETSSVDYSSTNIQVEGVDEPDIVKTDGKYIYILANSKIYIIFAYPAEEAMLISEIILDSSIYVSNIFINENKLIVLGTSYRDIPILETSSEEIQTSIAPYPKWDDMSTSIVNVYDISDRSNPDVAKEVEVDGNYQDARMIDDEIYIITTQYCYQICKTYQGNQTYEIPQVKVNNEVKKIPADHIHYNDIPERIETMTHVVAIDINDETINQQTFFISSSQIMYVSKNNIYLTYSGYNFIRPLKSLSFQEYTEETTIHKISIKNDKIEYKIDGKVPGRILNQFSMDEYKGYVRIATTIGQVWSTDQPSTNNVYILDEKLNRVSEIEDIAPGERIYSARFIGDKAYLVTFKKVDPFFTLDLSDPKNPKILGKLKIPGYSDYLHPLDENHIIGIGKDTVEPQGEENWGRDFAWYQGLKIAVFDVTDFENPKEIDKIIIGDRGTDSQALHNHKTFLFNREKELLVIPVSLYEIPDEIKEENNGYTGSTYGQFTFQGVYVYKLNLEGFEYKGRITHMDEEDYKKTGDFYWWGYPGSNQVERSLYINDVLYTISDSMIKMNNLRDLSEINSIELISK